MDLFSQTNPEIEAKVAPLAERVRPKDLNEFVGQAHLLSKDQQDAFLPHVEKGTIILIGATTENPGFEVNAPLISRMKVYHFEALTTEDIVQLLKRAKKLYPEHKVDPKALTHLANQANGDARSALNAFELAATLNPHISLAVAEAASQRKALYYDKKGDNHYDTISAFIKSMRGGSADGAVYYLARMLKAGEDPMFIARRMVIFASEDIANADPFAIVFATNVMEAVHMIGMPEAQLILAQGVTYLANAPKSTAPMDALFAAYQDIDTERLDPVPMHLRNAANKVMKELGAGKGYVRYQQNNPEKFKTQQYLPDNLKHKTYYDSSHDRQPKGRDKPS